MIMIYRLTSVVATDSHFVCACFKSGGDLFNFTFLPFSKHGILFSHLTLSNFTRLFQENQFGRWMLNSIFLSCAQTLGPSSVKRM